MVKIEDIKVGDSLRVIGNGNPIYHYIPIGNKVEVKIIGQDKIDVVGLSSSNVSIYQEISFADLDLDLESITEKQTIMITKSQMKSAVEAAAQKLASKNGNITTLELKEQLRKDIPAVLWNQYTTGSVEGVSNLFHELVNEGKFRSIANNGTYQTYVPAKAVTVNTIVKAITKANPKPLKAESTVATATKVTGSGASVRIARSKALSLMQDSKGHFFTATFIKKDGTERTINCQYLKDQDSITLGFVKVKEASKLKTDPKDAIRQINLQTIKALRIGGVNYRIRN